jgi:hypothetical protein
MMKYTIKQEQSYVVSLEKSDDVVYVKVGDYYVFEITDSGKVVRCGGIDVDETGLKVNGDGQVLIEDE